MINLVSPFPSPSRGTLLLHRPRSLLLLWTPAFVLIFPLTPAYPVFDPNAQLIQVWCSASVASRAMLGSFCRAYGLSPRVANSR